ncbi:MAG: DinB family protein [Sphingobacteriales bacterium]
MNTEINNYIAEFQTIYHGEPFYGKPLMAVVKDADPKKVFKKQNTGAHSAYEIAHHFLAWRELLVKRLNGDKKASIETDSSEDWAPLPKKQTSAEWNSLVKELEQNQKDLIKALAKWDDKSLDENFAGSAYPLRTFLNGQMQHDIYHIGQIALAIKNA